MPPLRQPLVVALAYDGLGTFELGLVVEVFGLERPEMGRDWYRFAVAALEPGPLRATGGLRLQASGGLELFRQAHTIVIPGWRGVQAPVPEVLCRALTRAHRRGARVMSICSGVFVLAAAGLLDGRRATTHWKYLDQLAERSPRVLVERDVLYVDEGSVLTSAGSAAGLDLCLHVVRRDYGLAAVNRVARRLVMPPHREGGQRQYVEAPVLTSELGSRLGPVIDSLHQRTGPIPGIAQLAREAAMSERNFVRKFKETTGLAPGAWLVRERVARARASLETTDLPIEQVADAVGFSNAAALRHHFRRLFALSPAQYRARWRSASTPS